MLSFQILAKLQHHASLVCAHFTDRYIYCTSLILKFRSFLPLYFIACMMFRSILEERVIKMCLWWQNMFHIKSFSCLYLSPFLTEHLGMGIEKTLSTPMPLLVLLLNRVKHFPGLWNCAALMYLFFRLFNCSTFALNYTDSRKWVDSVIWCNLSHSFVHSSNLCYDYICDFCHFCWLPWFAEETDQRIVKHVENGIDSLR